MSVLLRRKIAGEGLETSAGAVSVRPWSPVGAGAEAAEGPGDKARLETAHCCWSGRHPQRPRPRRSGLDCSVALASVQRETCGGAGAGQGRRGLAGSGAFLLVELR